MELLTVRRMACQSNRRTYSGHTQKPLLRHPRSHSQICQVPAGQIQLLVVLEYKSVAGEFGASVHDGCLKKKMAVQCRYSEDLCDSTFHFIGISDPFTTFPNDTRITPSFASSISFFQVPDRGLSSPVLKPPM